MAFYDFKCKECVLEDGRYLIFEAEFGMMDEKIADCPKCGGSNTKRIFAVPSLHEGMTAGEKSIGVPKQRVEYGKFMRDQREKRKRNYGPNTLEGQSNELWAGSTLPEGIKAPDKT